MWVNCDLDVLNSIIIITQMCIHQASLSGISFFVLILTIVQLDITLEFFFFLAI